MQNKSYTESLAPTYIINRSTIDESYTVWKLDLDNPALFSKYASQQETSLNASQYHLCAVGGYLLAYSKLNGEYDWDINYQLFKFDPKATNPLTAEPHLKGKWGLGKFMPYSSHLSWNPNDNNIVQLIPMTGYVLAYIPTSARATYKLWNFDPALDTPKPTAKQKSAKHPHWGPDPLSNALTTMDAFALIGEGSRLLPVDNYVLEWIPEDNKSRFRVWSFDPQAATPLALPFMSEGVWHDIDKHHQLTVLGNTVLHWHPEERTYTLWQFDPHSTTNPLTKKLASGTLPDDFNTNGNLTPVQSKVPVNKEKAKTPATMDFMREKIEHLVVYMVESRSMDNVLGWLYEHDDVKINFINGEEKYEGTSTAYFNEADGERFPVHKFNDGKVGDDFDLNSPSIDPYHGTPDSIHQQYSGGYPAYLRGDAPDMGGFVKNNCSREVMATLTPRQLPVLNGLAGSFAVSDQWFSPMPGGTDSNRAIALTGSAFNITTTLEGNPQYEYFPDYPHRQSIWKVLWNNGEKDWKIYWSVKWVNEVFTYQLYLKGDIPSVDNNVNDGKTDYIAPYDQFKKDAANNCLPKFSFIEPVWIAPSGATSFHPGGDLVPAEKQLNEIYEAVRKGPGWKKTALLITFSKGGGLYDHVPPPETVNPWPHDINDGFKYDVLGPRVPAIVVSPWVNENTVFRAPGETPLSATSIPATVLEWLGIPKARWGMGDRIPQSETFEFVFQRETARKDKQVFYPPHDKTYPKPHNASWSKDVTSGDWVSPDNWEGGQLATDKATFSTSKETEIWFKYESASSVNAIVFDSKAPAYTFRFGTSKNTALTIGGEGVINDSANQQHFKVAAESSGPWNPQLNFMNKACAGGSNNYYSAGPEYKDTSGGGVIRFSDDSRAGSANFVAWTGSATPTSKETVGGEISFYDNASADLGTFTAYGTLSKIDGDTFGNIVFHKFATAFKGTFTNAGGTVPKGDGGNTQFYDNTTAAYGIFNNEGATCNLGNGGDVAFDGNATAGFGCFYNGASKVKGGNGGVTSFNNNPPDTNGQGATACNGNFHNYGAPLKGGGGGHLRFSSVYGSPTAANATIFNYGSFIKDKNSAGNTSFSMNPAKDYYPTAGSATIHNQPAESKTGAAGYTEFTVISGYKNHIAVVPKQVKQGYVPMAGNATIYNHGGKSSGIVGGFTEFNSTTTAGDARIFVLGGENKGKGGQLTFANTARAGTARLIAEGGSEGGQGGHIFFNDKSDGQNAQVQLSGNAVLDVHQHQGKLTLDILNINEGSVTSTLGGKTTSIELSVELTLQSKQMKFKFVAAENFKPNTKYTVLSAPNLSQFSAEQFNANKIDGVKAEFSVVGDKLRVEYKSS